MSTIIAGRFKSFQEAKQAEALLIGSDFDADNICTFVVNPPGQHAEFPIGGDEYADAGTGHAAKSAVKGAVVGSAVGLGAGLAATAAVPEAFASTVTVATAAAGAYVGSLAGALNEMGTGQEGKKTTKPVEPRKAGVLVAARADDEFARQAARQALNRTGAQEIEIAQGTWSDGKWADFDPTVPPVPLR